jgi:hypothetical protein
MTHNRPSSGGETGSDTAVIVTFVLTAVSSSALAIQAGMGYAPSPAVALFVPALLLGTLSAVPIRVALPAAADHGLLWGGMGTLLLAVLASSLLPRQGPSSLLPLRAAVPVLVVAGLALVTVFLYRKMRKDQRAFGSGTPSPRAFGSGTQSPRAFGSGTESPRAFGSGTESPRAKPAAPPKSPRAKPAAPPKPAKPAEPATGREPSDRGQRPREPSDRGQRPREPSDRGQLPREPSDRGQLPREPSDRGQLPREPSDRGQPSDHHPSRRDQDDYWHRRGRQDDDYTREGFVDLGTVWGHSG